MLGAEAEWKKYRPAKEKYVGAKVLEALPIMFGDRGEYIVGISAWFRWVDDTIDEGDGTFAEKRAFLLKQQRLVSGDLSHTGNLHPMEEFLVNLPWNKVPMQTGNRVLILLSAIEDDLVHQGLKTRSAREIRHYNWRTMWPIIDVTFLVLNGHTIKESPRFMEMINDYVTLGSLDGIGDDLTQQVIKLPIPKSREGQTTAKEIEAYYSEAEFSKLKKQAIKSVWENKSEVWNLDIPTWQKACCFLYLCEAVIKKQLTLSRNKAFNSK
jgi:hypothetical protein